MEKITEVLGKYGSAKIFTQNYDVQAYRQVKALCDQPFAEGRKIRVMPDVHAGTGCVIGFTSDIGKKVIPAIVGVDIGCGMLVANLGKRRISLEWLDGIIRRFVPAGMNVHENDYSTGREIEDLRCKAHLHNTDWILRSLGTLGGGNHFIELDVDDEGNQYLVIHSGSRNLGKQVAEYYQRLAVSNLNRASRLKEARAEIIQRLKAEGREKEIEAELQNIRADFQAVPDNLCYLEGDDMADYLHDMRVCQKYAYCSRHEILYSVLYNIGRIDEVTDMFTTVHNYIGKDGIIRKGTVSAKKGEKLIIPLNMRDGSLICIGKGNPEWNFSAPHGAGRLYSRSAARQKFNVQEYQHEMKGIFTTSADESTLDECPMAYKPAESIMEAIEPTVDIVKHIRPVYNFKAGN